MNFDQPEDSNPQETEVLNQIHGLISRAKPSLIDPLLVKGEMELPPDYIPPTPLNLTNALSQIFSGKQMEITSSVVTFVTNLSQLPLNDELHRKYESIMADLSTLGVMDYSYELIAEELGSLAKFHYRNKLINQIFETQYNTTFDKIKFLTVGVLDPRDFNLIKEYARIEFEGLLSFFVLDDRKLPYVNEKGNGLLNLDKRKFFPRIFTQVLLFGLKDAVSRVKGEQLHSQFTTRSSEINLSNSVAIQAEANKVLLAYKDVLEMESKLASKEFTVKPSQTPSTPIYNVREQFIERLRRTYIRKLEDLGEVVKIRFQEAMKMWGETNGSSKVSGRLINELFGSGES